MVTNIGTMNITSTAMISNGMALSRIHIPIVMMNFATAMGTSRIFTTVTPIASWKCHRYSIARTRIKR